MTEIRYRPGKWFGIVSEHGIALLPDVLGEDEVKQVWASFAEGRGLAGVLETLTGAFGVGLMSLPPFAVVALDGGAARVAVRGDLIVEVVEDLVPDVAPIVLSGEGVTTWSERMIAGPVSISIRQKAARRGSALSLPICSGVVLCSRLTATYRGATVEAGPVEAESSTEETGPLSREPLVIREPLVESVAGPGPGSADDLDDWGYPRETAGSEVAAPVDLVPAPPALSAPTPAAAVDSPAKRIQVSATEPDPGPEPVAGPVQLAAEIAVPEQTRADDFTSPREETRELEVERGATDDEYDHLFGPTVTRAVEDAAVRTAEDESLIAGVPTFSASSSSTAATVEEDGDHDGHTISVAELRALQAVAPAASVIAPAPIAVIARLELSTGDVVDLDRPVIIGRRPAAGRTSADRLPHLVAVPSPLQDISRSHLEVRTEGRHVVARDLATVNGTVLRRPGQAPVRLNSSETVLVIGGDVLDLGDGVTVTVRETA